MGRSQGPIADVSSRYRPATSSRSCPNSQFWGRSAADLGDSSRRAGRRAGRARGRPWAGPQAARPKVLRLDYYCSKNPVTLVRVSPLASVSVQVAV
jgi:hypothetical protein